MACCETGLNLQYQHLHGYQPQCATHHPIHRSVQPMIPTSPWQPSLDSLVSTTMQRPQHHHGNQPRCVAQLKVSTTPKRRSTNSSVQLPTPTSPWKSNPTCRSTQRSVQLIPTTHLHGNQPATLTIYEYNPAHHSTHRSVQPMTPISPWQPIDPDASLNTQVSQGWI